MKTIIRNTNPFSLRKMIAAPVLFLVAFVFTLIATQTARAALLDSPMPPLGQFSYANNTAANASGQYFSTGGNGSSAPNPTYLNSSALTYLGYSSGFGYVTPGPATNSGLNFPTSSGKNGGIRTHLLTTHNITSGSVYLSCLLRINSTNTTANSRGLIGLIDQAGSSAQVNKAMWLLVNSAGQAGISKSGVTVMDVTNAANLADGKVHLIVMQYTFTGTVAGTDDPISLWVDPAVLTFGAAEGSLPTPSATGTPAFTDMTTVQCVEIEDGPLTGNGSQDIDEVRVGTTWADVLPSPTSICVAPALAYTSPTSTNQFEGLTMTFSSTITAGDDSGNPPAIQWQKSIDGTTWSSILNATNTSYTTPTLSLSDNGSKYRDIASTTCSSTPFTNSAITLTVNACAVAGITTSPASGSISSGYSTTLSVVATGGSPIYQWQQYDGVSTFTNIPGANSTNYTTPILTTANSGVQYRCHVVSGCNGSTADSAAATITVTCGTAQVSNPANATTTVGAPAVFTVTSTGSLPTYQWQRYDGVSTFTNIPGATFASYTNPAAASGDNGAQYRCAVNVSCDSSSVTSSAATLTVVAASTAKYRSNATGNWSNPNTWQASYDGGTTWVTPFAGPSDANDTIVVRSPNVVTVDTAFSVDQTTVNAGAAVVVASGVTLTISGTGTQLDVSGILNSAGTVTNVTGVIVFESGGLYQHNWTTSLGAIPIATWNTGSTCEIIGFTTASGTWDSGNLNQAFYNFSYDCTNCAVTGNGVVFDSLLTTVNGNFTHNAGSFTFDVSGGSATLNVAGNVTFAGQGGLSHVQLAFGPGSTMNLNIGGNLSVSNGTAIDVYEPSFTTITFTGPNCVYTNGSSPRWTGNEKTLIWNVPSGKKLTLQTPLAGGGTGGTDSGAGAVVNGTLDVNGQTCSFLNLNGASTGVITNSGAACNLALGYGAAGTFTASIGSLSSEFDGIIAGKISVFKQAATATTLLGGVNTYTGNTTITNDGSVLALTATGSINNSTNIIVGVVTGSTATFDVSAWSGGYSLVSGQTIKGSGIINGTLVVPAGAMVSPGSPGSNTLDTLTFNSTPTLSGTAFMEINRTNTPNADKIVSGALTFGGTLTVTNIGQVLTNGDTFDLFDATLSGNFGVTNLPYGAHHWITGDLNVGGTIVFTNYNPTASDFPMTVTVGGTITNNVFTQHATDPDGDALTVTSVSAPASGTASIVNATNVSYHSTGGSPGSDSFTYTVSDAFGGTDTKTVTVTINPAGPPPSAHLTNSFSGSTLTLSWPAGWRLQMQTNSLAVGLRTNWVDVAGSGSISSTNITVNPAQPTVFYRLINQ